MKNKVVEISLPNANNLFYSYNDQNRGYISGGINSWISGIE